MFKSYNLVYHPKSEKPILVGPGLEPPKDLVKLKSKLVVSRSKRTALKLAMMCKSFTELIDFYE